MNRLIALAFSALLAAAPAAHAQLTKEALALNAFGAELDDASTAPDFVGLAVAVVKSGKVAMVKTYGVREAGGKDRITPDTVFRLASLSKGFAGTMAAIEEKSGKLDLNTKVASIVPQFQLRKPADTAAVTLEDILTHRTGLPPYAFDNMLEAGTAPLDILSKYKTVRPTCAPGDCFTYQNTAFNMISTAIEKVSGNSYAKEVQTFILDPLGMTRTSFGRQALTSSGNWARPHRRNGIVWVPTDVKEPYYRVPAAGGMNSSINDMSHWLIAQMGERPEVLSPTVLIEVHRPRVDTPTETSRQRSLKTPVKKTEYGLGWRTFNYAGHTLITHSGGVEGYFAQIAWLPENHDGIVILANTRGTRAGKILPTWLDYELNLPKTDWFRLSEIPLAAATTQIPLSGD